MKLVIDISDEEYEDVKKAGGCYYDFGKAILYGTPYETVTEFADRCRECGREKVLDEIRAEIEQEPYVSKMQVLDIIDEYRAESEENDDMDAMLEHLWNDTADEESEEEVCSSNFIQLKQDVLNNKQLWRKLREIEGEDSD